MGYIFLGRPVDISWPSLHNWNHEIGKRRRMNHDCIRIKVHNRPALSSRYRSDSSCCNCHSSSSPTVSQGFAKGATHISKYLIVSLQKKLPTALRLIRQIPISSSSIFLHLLV